MSHQSTSIVYLDSMLTCPIPGAARYIGTGPDDRVNNAGTDSNASPLEPRFELCQDYNDCAASCSTEMTRLSDPPLSRNTYRCPAPMPIESCFPAEMSAGGVGTNLSNCGPTYQVKRANATVLYSHYQYISVGNLHRIPHEDASSLEAEGCLHLPTRPVLDDFVEQYFKHIHVFLPLLNEGDFWDMYSQNRDSTSTHNISLLVFQAVLFSSCSFVSQETIEILGFRSFRSARAQFYRRAKLLYDLETESTSLPLAQAALLLMGWVPPSNISLSPYKTWLALGIHHARSINADRYAETLFITESASLSERNHQNTLRRLWWCCIILDRLCSLSSRFSCQITHQQFDLKNNVPLGMADLEDEVYRSGVSVAATKRRQIALFSRFLDLMIIVTDVLSLAFSFEDSAMPCHSSRDENGSKVDKSEKVMRDWYTHTAARFPPYEDDNNKQPDQNSDADNSFVLHTNLMYIYYFTAEIALCNKKILGQFAAVSSTNPGFEGNISKEQLDKSRRKLQGAALRVTHCYGELTQRRLSRWLPISAVGCIAIPLALHVVTARLSSLCNEMTLNPRLTDSGATSASNQNRLDMLIKTMQAFFQQYYGVEWVKETVRYAAHLAQSNNQCLPRAGQESITDWSQILETQPTWYLRLFLTIDLCINRGRLPQKHDFPAWLRGRLSIWQEKQTQPKPSVIDSSIMTDVSLGCDIEHIMDFVPSLHELLPQDLPLAERANYTRSHKDGAGRCISEDWVSGEGLFAGGGPSNIDIDGMEWAMFGGMQDQVHEARSGST